MSAIASCSTCAPRPGASSCRVYVGATSIRIGGARAVLPADRGCGCDCDCDELRCEDSLSSSEDCAVREGPVLFRIGLKLYRSFNVIACFTLPAEGLPLDEVLGDMRREDGGVESCDDGDEADTEFRRLALDRIFESE